MKSIFRKLMIWGIMIVIIATMVPTTHGWAQTVHTSSPYEEFTPREEKEIEEFYWKVLFSQMHTDPAYYRGKDGLILKDEAEISAMIVLDEMLAFPAGEPGDERVRKLDQHWGNFFYNIASGKVSNRELRHQLKKVRREARRYGIPLW